jgi:hypothetical protein
MNRTLLFSTFGAAALMLVGCAAATTNTTTANKPATTASPAASSSPAASDKKAAKKPPASKTLPVPANWITMSDTSKGYEFMVPEGTQHKTDSVNGVDVYVATVPAPNDVAIIVFAFKDKNASKEDLLKSAEKALQGMGEKDIKIGTPTELSDDYSLATISSVDEKGKVTKGKVLVATDVTDNYVMLLGTDADKFEANEKTIDEIWGSFSMASGGYSGQS